MSWLSANHTKPSMLMHLLGCKFAERALPAAVLVWVTDAACPARSYPDSEANNHSGQVALTPCECVEHQSIGTGIIFTCWGSFTMRS